MPQFPISLGERLNDVTTQIRSLEEACTAEKIKTFEVLTPLNDECDQLQRQIQILELQLLLVRAAMSAKRFEDEIVGLQQEYQNQLQQRHNEFCLSFPDLLAAKDENFEAGVFIDLTAENKRLLSQRFNEKIYLEMQVHALFQIAPDKTGLEKQYAELKGCHETLDNQLASVMKQRTNQTLAWMLQQETREKKYASLKAIAIPLETIRCYWEDSYQAKWRQYLGFLETATETLSNMVADDCELATLHAYVRETFLSLIHQVVEQTTMLLGNPPCEFVLMGLDADIPLKKPGLSCFLLVSDAKEQNNLYFKTMLDLVRLKVTSLNTIQLLGEECRLNDAIKPEEDSRLCGTPIKIVQSIVNPKYFNRTEDVALNIALSLLNPQKLYGTGLLCKAYETVLATQTTQDSVYEFFKQVLLDRTQSNYPEKVGIVISGVIAYLLKINADLEIHTRYYKDLNTEHRPIYIRVLEVRLTHALSTQKPSLLALFDHLCNLPDAQGYRESISNGFRHLDEEIQSVTDAAVAIEGKFHAQIRWVNQHNQICTRYLKPDYIEQLLLPSGWLRKSYPTSRHAVASLAIGKAALHFKSHPDQPTLEYAVHLLHMLLAGGGTPTSTLAQFTVTDAETDMTISYPVLISETAGDLNLKKILDSAPGIIDRLDPYQYTQMVLLATLISLGDSASRNYVVSGKDNKVRIHSIDNEVAFVEPIVQKRHKLEIQLRTILFCLNQAAIPLDKQALQDFYDLNKENKSYNLLSRWLHLIEEREAAYIALHTDDEREALYNRESEDCVLTQFLLREGVLGGLLHQIEFLNIVITEALEAESFTLSALDLLTRVHPLVGSAYSAAFKRHRDTESRLASVSGLPITASLSSKQAIRASLGVIPSYQEVRRGRFSLPLARQELSAIRPQFSKLLLPTGEPDLKRQRVMLQELMRLPHTALDLSYCAELNNELLEQVLANSPELRTLDLRGCPGITDKAVLYLERAHANTLEELYLSDNPGLRWVEKGRVVKEGLVFPELRILHLSRCPNLIRFRATLPSVLIPKNLKLPAERDSDNLLLKTPNLLSLKSPDGCLRDILIGLAGDSAFQNLIYRFDTKIDAANMPYFYWEECTKRVRHNTLGTPILRINTDLAGKRRYRDVPSYNWRLKIVICILPLCEDSLDDIRAWAKMIDNECERPIIILAGVPQKHSKEGISQTLINTAGEVGFHGYFEGVLITDEEVELLFHMALDLYYLYKVLNEAAITESQILPLVHSKSSSYTPLTKRTGYPRTNFDSSLYKLGMFARSSALELRDALLSDPPNPSAQSTTGL